MSQTLTILAIPFIPADSEINKDRGTFSEFMGISAKLLNPLQNKGFSAIPCRNWKEPARVIIRM